MTNSSSNRALERLWLQALRRAEARGDPPPSAPLVAVPETVEARLALMIELSEASATADWRLTHPEPIRGKRFLL